MRERKIFLLIYLCLLSITLRNLLDAQRIKNVKVLLGAEYD